MSCNNCELTSTSVGIKLRDWILRKQSRNKRILLDCGNNPSKIVVLPPIPCNFLERRNCRIRIMFEMRMIFGKVVVGGIQTQIPTVGDQFSWDGALENREWRVKIPIRWTAFNQNAVILVDIKKNTDMMNGDSWKLINHHIGIFLDIYNRILIECCSSYR